MVIYEWYSVREESETDKALWGNQNDSWNTLAVDIYWIQIEPEEGKFDFTNLDALLEKPVDMGLVNSPVGSHMEKW